MAPTPIDSPRSGLRAWWDRTPLYARIIGAMLVGVPVGVLLANPWTLGRVTNYDLLVWIAIPSKLVLRLLGALASALILLAIIQALIKAQFEKGTGPRLIRLLLLNTLVAIFIGLLVANVIRPGHWSSLAAAPQGSADAPAAKAGVLQQFLENVPQSLLGPLGDNGRVIGVIFIAVAAGFALRQLARKRSIAPVPELVDIGLSAFVIMLHWIVAVLPLAVFGIVANLIGLRGFAAFQALGGFVVAVLCALLLQAVYYLARVRFGSWVRPGDLLRGTRDALVMAFSTGSSTATMPVTYECLRQRVGIREKSASLGALVGANFNNDGTALYEAMSALFVSQILTHSGIGAPLDLGQQLLVVVTSVIASIGAAGIPEAGLVTMTLVFSAVHLPVEYIAILLPIDWFLDRCRTAINVMGDTNVACLLDGKHRPGAAEAAEPIPATNDAVAFP